jgi:hypothetical protein
MAVLTDADPDHRSWCRAAKTADIIIPKILCVVVDTEKTSVELILLVWLVALAMPFTWCRTYTLSTRTASIGSWSTPTLARWSD